MQATGGLKQNKSFATDDIHLHIIKPFLGITAGPLRKHFHLLSKGAESLTV